MGRRILKTITDSLIFETNELMWAAASKRHGSLTRVPQEEVAAIGETIRGLHVLRVWQSRGGSAGNPVKFMREYSVNENVIKELVAQYAGNEQLLAAERTLKAPKRSEKWRALEDWAKQHFLEEVTTEQMVEVAGFSYPTVLNYLKTSPYFRKIKKGVWEVRDPKSDRAREKNG